MKIGQGYVFFTPQWWWIIILCLVIAFSLGWLFPIEGPFDYVYDDYASQPAHNRPSKCCASPVEKQTSIIPPSSTLIDETSISGVNSPA